MTSEDTPRPLSLSSLGSEGAALRRPKSRTLQDPRGVHHEPELRTPAGVPSPVTVRRWDETSCFCGRVSGLSAQTSSPIASNFPSARHGGARSTCDAASPENWLTALCPRFRRSLPIASFRRGRDRSTAPNPDSRPLKCRSARGVDSRPLAEVTGHKYTGSSGAPSSYSTRPNAAIFPSSCGLELC
jgi:hypothetical protein